MKDRARRRWCMAPLVASTLWLVVVGCTSSGPRKTLASTSTSTPTSTTITTISVGGCSRPAGKGVVDSVGGGLSDIKMVSAGRGWAVGKGIIAGTSDGTHWSDEYSGPERFLDVDAVDALHAWAVGTEQLFNTNDGGRHWTQVGEPDEPLQSIDFIDASQGFGIAGFPQVVVAAGYTVPSRGGTLVTTADGGRTWERRSAPCDAQAVCATDSDNAWLVAGDQLYRTHDGGGVWQPVLTLASYRTPGGYLQCPGGGAAWVLRKGSNGASQHLDFVVYHTSDDGRTWNTVMVEPYTNVAHIPAPPGPGSYPGPFAALSPTDAVFVGATPPSDDPTSTMLANSGGRTLGPERPVPVGSFFPEGANYLTAQKGWIVGQVGNGPGLIVGTSDGGRTWQTQFQTP